MRRIFAPLILFLLIVLEGVSQELLPEMIVSSQTLIIPHWVFIFLVLVAIFFVAVISFYVVIFYYFWFVKRYRLHRVPRYLYDCLYNNDFYCPSIYKNFSSKLFYDLDIYNDRTIYRR